MSRFQELVEFVNTFEKDFEKFYDKGNKSAGTRVRKHMAELKRKAQEIRNEVQAMKKGGEDEGSTPGPDSSSTPAA
ncbi:MAG: histone H1 [Bacteroidota bacterium]